MPIAPRPAPRQVPPAPGFPVHVAARQREKIYAPLKILSVVRALAECGVAGDAALADTGLSLDQIRDPDVLTSVQQLLTVGRNAVRLCPDPLLGLFAGQRMHVSSYGLYGYAMLCANTMRQGFEMALRYQDLGTPVMPMNLLEEGSVAIWQLPRHEDVAVLGLSAAEYACFLDMQFAITLTLVKDVMGPWCVPTEVLYALPQPPHAEEMARMLECPVRFGQDVNQLHYPRAWLERAPHMANPITAAQMSETCERLMTQISWQAGLTRRVYEELTRTPGRFASIEAVAASLCMTSRTLRRRLSAEGTSFSDLLARVRHALALDYLRSTQLSVEDIAAALGFSDASSFRHAFKRWSGKSPLEWRTNPGRVAP